MDIKNIENPVGFRVNFSSDQKQVLVKVRHWAQDFYTKEERHGGPLLGGHGFDHTMRVCGMSVVLSVLEKVDPFLQVVSALLHDVGRAVDEPRALTYLHGQLSRELSENFLDSLEILTDQDKHVVKNAIEDHPFLNEKVRLSDVVKILMDADRLDGLGAIGPVRSGAVRWRLPIFTSQTDQGGQEWQLTSVFQDFSVRVPEWQKMLWTKSAQEIAVSRAEFLRGFIDEFYREAAFMQKSFDQLGI